MSDTTKQVNNGLPMPVFNKGITPSQIEKVVEAAKTDPDIVNLTHDPERFKNIESFNSWTPGKEIYTLTGSDDELYGIIWFQEKTVPGIDALYTFAIRIYPPARGKGLAKGFMKKAFEAFGKYPVWLSTKEINTKAIKLYNEFGFKEIKREKGEVYMIYSG